MLTVGELVAALGLELAVGQAETGRRVRWVQISEHADPGRWLSGQELVLTSGRRLSSPATQARFVSVLADRGVAGLGFGLGSIHPRLPDAVVDAARSRRLPLFEIPPALPFIAISSCAATRIIDEHRRQLKRTHRFHERLERLVVEGERVEQVMAATAREIQGAALLLDSSGGELAREATSEKLLPEAVAAVINRIRPRDGAEARAFSPEPPELGRRSFAVPVARAGRDDPQTWLVVVSKGAVLDRFERLCARHAAHVIALALAPERELANLEVPPAAEMLAERPRIKGSDPHRVGARSNGASGR